MVTSYRYDPHGRLLDLATRRGEDLVSRFTYSHDAAGNRAGITYADGSRSEYAFDDAYRLTRDRRLDANGAAVYDETYTYDRVGNRLTKRRTGWNPVAVDYIYNARNQLVRTTGSEPATYAYDPDGNLVAVDRGNAGSESMTYDVLGRLTRYQGPAGVESYTHRGAGWKRHSVATQPAGGEATSTAYLYDGDNVLADLGTDAAVKYIYATHDLDEPLAMILAQGGHYYYTHDGLGSVRNLTTGNGTVQSAYDYTAFGELFNAAAGVIQRYGYTGREMENLGGGMHYRYRQYDPISGRFGRRDPAGYNNNDFLNLYEYVNSATTTLVDPFGLRVHRKYVNDIDNERRRRATNRWNTAKEGSQKCLKRMCEGLPVSANPNCPEDGSKEQCENDADGVVDAYAQALRNLRNSSWCASLGLTGIGGNLCSGIPWLLWEGGIGCQRTADAIEKATKARGMIQPKYVMTDGTHAFVVFHRDGSNVFCATTAWETGTPSMEDFGMYRPGYAFPPEPGQFNLER